MLLNIFSTYLPNGFSLKDLIESAYKLISLAFAPLLTTDLLLIFYDWVNKRFPTGGALFIKDLPMMQRWKLQYAILLTEPISGIK